MPTPWPGPRGPRAPPGLTRGYPNPGSDPRRGPPSPAPAHRSHRYPDLVPGQAQTLPGRSSALRTEAGPAGVAWDRPRPWARRGHPSPERAPCRPQPGFCRRALGLARPPSRVPPHGNFPSGWEDSLAVSWKPIPRSPAIATSSALPRSGPILSTLLRNGRPVSQATPALGGTCAVRVPPPRCPRCPRCGGQAPSPRRRLQPSPSVRLAGVL